MTTRILEPDAFWLGGLSADQWRALESIAGVTFPDDARERVNDLAGYYRGTGEIYRRASRPSDLRPALAHLQKAAQAFADALASLGTDQPAVVSLIEQRLALMHISIDVKDARSTAAAVAKAAVAAIDALPSSLGARKSVVPGSDRLIEKALGELKALTGKGPQSAIAVEFAKRLVEYVYGTKRTSAAIGQQLKRKNGSGKAAISGSRRSR